MRKLFLVLVLSLVLVGCGKKKLVCLNGYTLNEQDKTCERVVSIDAKEIYHCSGFNSTLDGKQCRLVTYTPAIPNRKCNETYSLKDNTCVKDNTTHNTSKCDTSSTYSKTDGECYKVLEPMTTYSCEQGKLDGVNCATIDYVNAEIEYICEDTSYNLVGSKCIKTLVADAKEAK